MGEALVGRTKRLLAFQRMKEDPCGICSPGIERDHAAVEAALSRAESNGQTEGHVTRLKLIKRQMYGRAKFDLLRLRVIHAA